MFCLQILFIAKRRRWSTPEKEVLKSVLNVPSVSECELIIQKNKDVLGKRTPEAVKSFIYSTIKTKSF